MIQLTVEVSDLDGTDSKFLTLPCDLHTQLENYYDYIILSIDHGIQVNRNDNIKELNDILDEINSENPGMTEDYLEVLLEASLSGDLFDPEFIRKLSENDFMFEDISYIHSSMDAQETAAYYLATVLKVPFESGITSEMLDVLSSDIIKEYIDWEKIWDQYSSVGFRLIERDVPEKKRYIVHIK